MIYKCMYLFVKILYFEIYLIPVIIGNKSRWINYSNIVQCILISFNYHINGY